MNGLPAFVTILDLGTGTLSSSAVFPASQTTNGVATTLGVSLVQIASAMFSATIVPVTSGGTNTSSLTAFGLLFGNGSSTVGITAAGGTALPLIGNGPAAAPSFAVLSVPGGGINTTALTQNGIIFGNGTSTVGITGAGNTALALISPGPLVAPAFGQISLTAAVTGVLGVPNGGHGTSTLTAFGVVFGNGTSTVGITAAGGTGVPLVGAGTSAAAGFTTTLASPIVVGATLANQVQIQGGTSGANVVGLQSIGSDANVNLFLNAQGTAAFLQLGVAAGTGAVARLQTNSGTSAANGVILTAGQSGSSPIIASGDLTGTGNPNIGLTFQTIGTGTINTPASVVARSGLAIPAGGTAGGGFMVSSVSNFGLFFGSGVPSLSAATGSLYMRSDGATATTRMYININGTGTWTGVTTVA